MSIILDFVGFIVFITTNLFCILYSRKILGTYLNITVVLAVPYMLVCLFQVIMAISGNFVFPCLKYWLILAYFILLTLIFEIFSNYFILNAKGKKIKALATKNLRINATNQGLTIIVSVFLVFILKSVLTQVLNVKMGLLFQNSFQSDFENSLGGNFYTRVALMFFATYFLASPDRWYKYLLGALCFVPSIVVNTKGVILIPVLGILFANYLYGRIKNIFKIISIIIIAGIFVFFGSYFLQYYVVKEDSINDLSFIGYLVGKFINYALAGVQSFNYCVSNGQEYIFHDLQNCTLAPFNSILANLGLVNSYSPVNPIFISSGNIPNYGPLTSNVNTYFGTLYLFNGIAGGAVIHLFWVFIASGFRINSLLTSNPFLIVLFSLFLSGFALGWFEFYFMHTFWFYMIILAIILIGVFKNNKYYVRI